MKKLAHTSLLAGFLGIAPLCATYRDPNDFEVPVFPSVDLIKDDELPRENFKIVESVYAIREEYDIPIFSRPAKRKVRSFSRPPKTISPKNTFKGKGAFQKCWI